MVEQSDAKPSVRMGAGVLKSIRLDLGAYTVITSPSAWRTARLSFNSPETVVMVESMETRVLDGLLDAIPPCRTIVGLGGGRALDAAKYFAWKRGCRLVLAPTIISTDAFASPRAAVRIDGEAAYLGHGVPDPLIIDFDLLRRAPSDLILSGISTLLAILTASFDWQLSHRVGRLDFPLLRDEMQKAETILDKTLERLPEIGRLTDGGLAAMIEGCLELNALCRSVGHYRLAEGSEHYFTYALEERLCRPLPYGPMIGLGVFLMSRLQDNRHADITRIMTEGGLEYHPRAFGLSRQILTATLLHLKAFVSAREAFWYTIINEIEITPTWVDEALAGLQF